VAPSRVTANRAAGHGLHPFAGAVDRCQDAPRLLEHHLARDRERHASRGTVEQLRADFLLEFRNLVRNCRLRHIAGARGACEVTLLGHHDKRFQIGEGRIGNGRAHIRSHPRRAIHSCAEPKYLSAAEKNPKGEVHEDLGILSFDTARGRIVLRQFHTEGFVNEYVQDVGASSKRLVLVTEAIENIPSGWRARETYSVPGPDEFEEIFELAAPGKTSSCIRART
jgi:hypothetical protein